MPPTVADKSPDVTVSWLSMRSTVEGAVLSPTVTAASPGAIAAIEGAGDVTPPGFLSGVAGCVVVVVVGADFTAGEVTVVSVAFVTAVELIVGMADCAI
jgi:hypothetical protein